MGTHASLKLVHEFLVSDLGGLWLFFGFGGGTENVNFVTVDATFSLVEGLGALLWVPGKRSLDILGLILAALVVNLVVNLFNFYV